jgi:hypothetical protein
MPEPQNDGRAPDPAWPAATNMLGVAMAPSGAPISSDVIHNGFLGAQVAATAALSEASVIDKAATGPDHDRYEPG